MNTWIASIAAVAVQPLVLAARMAPDLLGSSQPLYGLGIFVLAVVAVAATATLLVGVPAFIALRKLKRDSWTSLGFTGALIGALPVAFSWPSRTEGYSSGRNWHGRYVELYVNGVPTEFAWLTYAESVVFFAIHGAIGALVFYAVWRRLERPQPPVPRGEA